MFRLWCAGILCKYPELKRFRFSCLYCRYRRKYLGKWTLPPYWIDYTVPWTLGYSAIVKEQKLVALRKMWFYLKIDPRGHFTLLRCSAIVALDKIMKRFRWTEKPLMEFCELLANYPVW